MADFGDDCLSFGGYTWFGTDVEMVREAMKLGATHAMLPSGWFGGAFVRIADGIFTPIASWMHRYTGFYMRQSFMLYREEISVSGISMYIKLEALDE